MHCAVVSVDQINSVNTPPVIFTSWLCVTQCAVVSTQDQSTAMPATLTQDTRTLGNRWDATTTTSTVAAVDATTAVYGRGAVAEEGAV